MMDMLSPVGARLLEAVSRRYSSDAAFERAAGLPPKTVSNWRRGRSTSYMKLLPDLCRTLGVKPEEVLTGEEGDGSPVTREEAILLEAFRQTADLSPAERASLLQTLLSMIRLSLGGVR